MRPGKTLVMIFFMENAFAFILRCVEINAGAGTRVGSHALQ